MIKAIRWSIHLLIFHQIAQFVYLYIFLPIWYLFSLINLTLTAWELYSYNLTLVNGFCKQNSIQNNAAYKISHISRLTCEGDPPVIGSHVRKRRVCVIYIGYGVLGDVAYGGRVTVLHGTGLLSGPQRNAAASLWFVDRFATYTTKRTRDGSALPWRPERGLTSFCSVLGFLRFLIFALFLYYLFSAPSLLDEMKLFPETFAHWFYSFLEVFQPTLKHKITNAFIVSDEV